jgi:4-amino-4-deoxy-L-arabinose transferase-like glycosyltransferase
LFTDPRLRTVFDRFGVWIAAILVVVLFGAPLFRGLRATDLKGDEPIYSFAVDQMLAHGDWSTPKSIPDEHVGFLEKPPLKIWLVAAGIKAGLPNDEFGHRFWDPVFGVAAFLYVLLIGRRIGGLVCGLVAVLVLFVHRPLIYEHGLRTNNMEAALLLSYCGGLFHALVWSSSAARADRWRHAAMFGLWFALGFMTKFVAAIFLPAIVVLNAAIFPSWRRRLLGDWLIWGLVSLGVVIVCAPWFVYESFRYGKDFWHIILGEHVYKRFTTFLDPSHVRPWYWYFTTLYTELQWSQVSVLIGLGVAALLFRTVRRRWPDGALILLWFVVPMAAISTGSSKLYHYVYPFLPPLALAAGFVPATLLEPDSMLRNLLRRAVDWLGASWLARRVGSGRPALRSALIAIAAIAFGIAVWSAVSPVRIDVGDVTIFRNSSTARPMIVAALLLSIAGLGRMVAGALLIPLLILALPLGPYRDVTKFLDREDLPLHRLRNCLVALQGRGRPPGIYVHAEDVGHWGYFYYLMPAGFDHNQERSEDILERRLFTAGQERPSFLSRQEYAHFAQRLARIDPSLHWNQWLDSMPRVVFPDGRMMLLPEGYGSCGVKR